MNEDALVVAEIAELVRLDFVFFGFVVIHIPFPGTVTSVVKLFIRRISLPPFRLCFNPCAWLTSPDALEEAVGLGHRTNR